MTTAQALSCCIWHLFDKRPMPRRTRAFVIEAIPPQCRFLDPEGRIENMATITVLFDHLHDQARKGQYPPPPPPPRTPPEEWSEDEADT
jgi:hypothetical protein